MIFQTDKWEILFVGFDKKLLQRLKVILAVISSYNEINVEMFKEYCYETAKEYKRLYNWYYMPPSLHVILIHGWRVIEKMILPIGMFSEEAQECINKYIKKYKLDFACKNSR